MFQLEKRSYTDWILAKEKTIEKGAVHLEPNVDM